MRPLMLSASVFSKKKEVPGVNKAKEIFKKFIAPEDIETPIIPIPESEKKYKGFGKKKSEVSDDSSIG
jgi:hypothetical protein